MTYDTQLPLPVERPKNAFANAFSALQLMVFRSPARPITGRPRDVLLALFLLFGATLASHRSYFSGDVTFSVWGFQGWFSGTALLYLSVATIAIFVRREATIGVLLVILPMALTLGTLVNTALFLSVGAMLPPLIRNALYVGFGFLPMVIAMTAITMTPRRRDGWRGFVIGLGSMALTAVTTIYFGHSYLFVPSHGEDNSAVDRDWTPADPEILYPQQMSLLSAQTDILSAQTPGQIDLYAVLGAGTPYQHLFQREIEAMQSTLVARFGAQGKTVMLGATVQEHTARPLLNRTNFTASLHAIAATMDKSEDIALIFLTSHGSPEQLSTSFPGLGYNNLTSIEVANALNESGIQNAIVIISACYSGSFIDEIAGPNRLVLTASAADRASFGCEESNTLTNWGNAFIATALQETLDMRTAAQAAQVAVEEQENAQGQEPSHPQISEGDNIGAVLDRFISEISSHE